MMFGLCGERTPRLTNCEVIFEEFQPMLSRYLNVTHGWTDRDRRTGDLLRSA